ncbi:Transcription elongation factor (TFIIS) family protein [Rhynchospora pubera]|uniref:Transcription elongation factor (TFIIS) family protein n=1 Tax=Rhynchospora pubera TaxID=906938 RepID=A0AAV8CAW9_9POAL|nr:Transcription elongation factor (TFIIS) family protein [Rhynchospora pubera]
MDPSEERLRQVLDAVGVDLWSLIDTAIAVATRDHPGDLRHRREGIVQSLYALTPCRNCDRNHRDRDELANGHGADSARTYRDGSAVTYNNGDGSGVNPGYHVEASPEMHTTLSPTPTPSPEAPASPELDLERDDETREIPFHDLMSIKELLENPDQQPDDETLVCLLQNLAVMDVTKEALVKTEIPRLVTPLRRHPCEEVRQLAKPILSKWKELVLNSAPTPTRDSSTSPAAPTEDVSPQRIPARSRQQNSNGPHEFMRSPKRQNGVFSAERSGSDSVNSKAGSSSRSEAPARPNNQHRSATPSVAPPARRNEKEEQAKLDVARKRLQDNYKEAQNAKKQRTVQVMSLNEIPKPKNAFIRKAGSTSRNR